MLRTLLVLLTVSCMQFACGSSIPANQTQDVQRASGLEENAPHVVRLRQQFLQSSAPSQAQLLKLGTGHIYCPVYDTVEKYRTSGQHIRLRFRQTDAGLAAWYNPMHGSPDVEYKVKADAGSILAYRDIANSDRFALRQGSGTLTVEFIRTDRSTSLPALQDKSAFATSYAECALAE